MKSRLAILCVLILPAFGAGKYSLKQLLDPTHKDFTLEAWTWDQWEGLDKETRLKSKGVDPSEWQTPPPEPMTEEEKKEAEEKKRKREEAKKAGRLPKNPPDRFPGFKFERRLLKKKQAFNELLGPATATTLEGLIKKLKSLDKAFSKLNRVTAEVREAYDQYAAQLAKIQEVYARNYKKKYGKYPEMFQAPPGLIRNSRRASKTLQRLLAVRQSETQFHDWIVFRIAELCGELNEAEVKKPLAALKRGMTDKDWRYRVRCAKVLAHMSGAGATAVYKTAMEKEKDPLVLTELIRIRIRKGGADVMELLKTRLDDPHWTVRAAVVRELANHRKKEVVDLLVARMQKEDGRLLDDLADALTRITGKRFQPEPDPWRIWWEKARATWTPPQKQSGGDQPKEGQQAGVVYFYGIQTRSKRVVFCIDVSGSMDFPLDGRNGKKEPRIKKAKTELYQALAGLPEDALFSIVVYNASVRVWKKRMQPANQKNKMAARKFVEKMEPAGATNIFDALLTSMEIAATVGKAKKGEDPQADTIFFLTDGRPTNGKIVDPHQILDEVGRRNELLGLTIHTIGVSKDQNRSFLLNLAKQNNGKYVSHTK